MYNTITYEVSDRLATITFNRPEVFNALSGELLAETRQAVEAAASDKSVRVIVLTGSGDRAFCSGADLKEGIMLGQTSLADRLRSHYNPLIRAMRTAEKPIVCRLNGIAAGAGMSLALACDIIIAQKDAYMTELFVGIGLLPDAGSMFFLPRIVGMQKAFELCSTGRKVYMEEALQLGLVSKVVAYEDLDKTVGELVEFYKNAPTKSIGLMKKVLNHSFDATLDEVLDMEAHGQDTLGRTHDFAEGVMAFIQKRKANFKGE
jgi:2-(1,2-epoxy-1,2-dihydrophenyl)acetyl-CoA isomerase